MTDWSLTDGLVPAVDAVSGATPLTALKEALISGSTVTEFFAESGLTLKQMLMDVGASAGEISSIALLVGFAYLLVRKVVKIWIPLSIFATVIVVSGIFSLVNPDLYTGPLFNIFTGGMVLGACFMATDYVTSPMSTVVRYRHRCDSHDDTLLRLLSRGNVVRDSHHELRRASAQQVVPQ